MVLLQQTIEDVFVSSMAQDAWYGEKEDILGYYMLSVLSLEDEFKQKKFKRIMIVLDLNEEEGLIARGNFVRLLQETGFCNGLYCDT